MPAAEVSNKTLSAHLQQVPSSWKWQHWNCLLSLPTWPMSGRLMGQRTIFASCLGLDPSLPGDVALAVAFAVAFAFAAAAAAALDCQYSWAAALALPVAFPSPQH